MRRPVGDVADDLNVDPHRLARDRRRRVRSRVRQRHLPLRALPADHEEGTLHRDRARIVREAELQ